MVDINSKSELHPFYLYLCIDHYERNEFTMNKELVIKQIFMPKPNLNNEYTNYQKQLQPREDFESESLKEFFLKRENELMGLIAYEATLYLNDDESCNDDVDMFPRRCDLTGEWYVGDVSIWEDGENIRSSIYIRFLGFHPDPSMRYLVDDYLGMEAGFDYNKTRDTFIFDGFNTAVI